MVVKKSAENEATGFHVPIIPRARRSVRARCPQKKIVNDNQMCAIEILASLAGKLLQESESSSACSNVSEENNNNNNIAIGKDAIKQEIQEGEKPSKAQCMDQGTESSLGSEKECGEMKPICHSNNVFGSSNKEASDSFRNEPSSSLDYKNEARRKQNSDSQTKKPLWWKPIPNASGSRHDHDDTKLCSRDDGDNFSIYNKASKNFKHPQRIGDDRIRKLLTSKYWKASPKLKDFEPSKTYGGMQPFYRKRKTCFNWERSHRDSFYKRRKLFDRRSVINSDGIYCSESITSSLRKGMNDDENGLPAMLHGENGVSSSVLGHQASFHTKESHVKFSIKSFKIPELLIEVPQTTTVGSLKRTVMEAVTAILGGGLHVGVLFQGKKIRDDSRTLLQSGISCKDNIDTLGFTLEPNSLQAPQITGPEEPPLISPRGAPQLLTRDNPVLDHPRFPDALRDQPLLLTGVSNNVENNLSHPNIVADKMMPESGALVPVPPISPKPLAVVPLNQKNRRSDMARRRIRRPFSVSEVEALVQAVEQLGTGRWRDVKLRAFENADHRTYVDLKDKWKTLVHTASIAPQQRRGEPVPQELLDRVLSAHAYWSQYQAKQGGKHQAASLKIAEDRAGLKASKPCEV